MSEEWPQETGKPKGSTMSTKEKFESLTQKDWELIAANATVAQQATLIEIQRSELAALREELAKVIEDRARFPDRPDFIGNMISAHIGNLKAKADSAERYSKMWSDRLTAAEQRNEILELDAARYRFIRQQGEEQNFICLAETLDGMDAAIDAALKPTESGASE